MQEKDMWACIGFAVIFAPLILLIIGIVQIHKLKSAVRNLVKRVAELESGGDRIPAPVSVTAAEKVPVVAPPVAAPPARPPPAAPPKAFAPVPPPPPPPPTL